MKNDSFSLRSRLRSFRFAFRGFVSLLRNEHNARIHLIAAIVAISAGFFLEIDTLEWTVIIIVTGLVFMAELFNSSIEALADIVNPAIDERIRKTKDYAAAAVLIAALISVIAGGLIFVPKILSLLQN